MGREDLERAMNRDRSRDEKVDPIRREMLQIRDYKVDLESKLGKSVVITKNTPQAASGGYYCNVCDCVVKDSINFLDHINGKKLEEKKKECDVDERLKELRDEEEKAREYR